MKRFFLTGPTAFGVALGVALGLTGGLYEPSAFAAPVQVAAGQVPPVGPDDYVLGKDDAPVTVIEYASFTCPHCSRWEKDVFPEVRKSLIETGKIRYVFRDFPLDGAALKASQLARCAGKDRYYGFVEALFQLQLKWARSPDPVQELVNIGKLGGISQEKAQACLTDQKLELAIAATQQGGETAGVDSTPTFFIAGKKVAGEIPLDQFVKYVTEAGGKS